MFTATTCWLYNFFLCSFEIIIPKRNFKMAATWAYKLLTVRHTAIRKRKWLKQMDITYLFKQSNASDVKLFTVVQVWQNASNKASATFDKITRFWSLIHTSVDRSSYLEICPSIKNIGFISFSISGTCYLLLRVILKKSNPKHHLRFNSTKVLHFLFAFVK